LNSLVMVLAEVGLALAIVDATGYWASPYVFCLAAAILAAGFARGFGFAIRTACAAIAAVAIPYHVEVASSDPALTVQWAAELLLIALVAGYARRLFGEAEEQSALARKANDLLTQLNAVARTLPASLDLEETLHTTIGRLRDLFPIDAIVVLLDEDASESTWSVAAAEGIRLPVLIPDATLPYPARQALAENRSVLATNGLSPDTRSAIFLPLSARDRTIGLIAVEHRTPERFGADELQLGDEVAAQAALALDNARWFSRLRTIGADEERTRIARDLHDRVGQSLAFVSFELDRISRATTNGDSSIKDELAQLRDEVRKVVTEVRDTLYDLRTDVSERKDLVVTLGEFLDRVAERTGIDVRFDHAGDRRLPVPQERELWRIAQEAVTNACRHSGAATIKVGWRCDDAGAVLEVRDDGKGVGDPAVPTRPDAYGILGMRERSAALGGRLEILSPPTGGTLVRCEVPA
jgi:signal transduction histidine kinase